MKVKRLKEFLAALSEDLNNADVCIIVDNEEYDIHSVIKVYGDRIVMDLSHD
jgi:hypothetical protein